MECGKSEIVDTLQKSLNINLFIDLLTVSVLKITYKNEVSCKQNSKLIIIISS